MAFADLLQINADVNNIATSDNTPKVTCVFLESLKGTWTGRYPYIPNEANVRCDSSRDKSSNPFLIYCHHSLSSESPHCITIMSNMNKVLGFERINERRQRPNKLINFIKPLKGPDEELAQDFLERVAAICYPIMKNNHVVVMSLEEYPSNKEFLGRNFNAGEIIQLVLKAPSGNWYPFKHVQMVMMHELAHCKQMNHSRAFWKVNNSNRDELKELWAKKYTGEGLWGRGQTLLSGRYSNDHMPEANDVPENLCGGTYKSRGGKKRKRKDVDKSQFTYAERKQRKIAKKFGVNGQALGEDGLARFELDQGRYRPGKPRVANSKRGRELRVAAALARFDKPKEDVSSGLSPVGSSDGYDDDDDNDSDFDGDEEPINRHWDENDNVVKICEDGDLDDGDAQREMDDLREIDRPEDTGKQARSKQPVLERTEKQVKKQSRPALISIDDDESTNSEVGSQESTASENEPDTPSNPEAATKKIYKGWNLVAMKASSSALARSNTDVPDPIASSSSESASKPASIKSPPAPSTSIATASKPRTRINITKSAPRPLSQPKPKTTASAPSSNLPAPAIPPPAPAFKSPACDVCSFENEVGAATCTMCAHVLDTNKIKNSWQCHSAACAGSVYRNLGDYGRCYVCQAVRPDMG